MKETAHSLSPSVLVVGSGPAALASAISCARANLSVTIVAPKRQLAHSRTTTVESLHPSVLSLLEVLGAADAARSAAVGTFQTVATNRGSHRLGDSAAPHGTHVDKTKFVSALWRQAAAFGVRFLTAKVSAVRTADRAVCLFLSDGQSMTAPWGIVGAGSRLLADRGIFNPKYLSPPLTAWTGLLKDKVSVAFTTGPTFQAREDGWSWYAPISNHQTTWTALAASSDRNRLHVRELYTASIPGTAFASDVRWRMMRPVVHQRILLTGDAAGRLDPAYGQGILSALLSGIQAAATIVLSEQQPALESWHLATYDQWFIERFEASANTLRRYYDTLGIRILA